MRIERVPLRGLYAVTPETPDTKWLLRRSRACLEAGARLLQYRAKTLAPDVALRQATALAAACRDTGALFIVNDSIELALAAGADGVHLGRDDMPVAQARSRLPSAIIGVSCYAQPESARAARAAGADYVAIGSVFASATKPSAVRAPLEMIASAKRAGGLPVAAIGGIDARNAADAVAAGADMLAVISALFGAPDTGAAARALSRCFDESEETHDV